MTDATQGIESKANSLDAAITRLEQARPFSKHRFQQPVLDVVGRILKIPGGMELIYERAARMDEAGVFYGSDWDAPSSLLPQLVGHTLDGESEVLATIEAISLLRILSVVNGKSHNAHLTPEHAKQYLSQVLALNLKRFFRFSDEASRAAADRQSSNERLLQFIADHVGLSDVLGMLVGEVWRILEQRPVQVGSVKEMITQISIALDRNGSDLGGERVGAERLISALFGPTVETMQDPGVEGYLANLEYLDDAGLSREASGFARSMHDTGLVSDYHVAFIKWALDYPDRPLIPEALGLGSTGLDSWRNYRRLIEELVVTAITPATPQAVYGLAMLLERGILHMPALAPALKRVLGLDIAPAIRSRIAQGFGDTASAETFLVAGIIGIIGSPLGVGQGANPTCQSARAISIWALNAPDYLLHLLVQAAEAEVLLMPFEGATISSADLPAGLAGFGPIDADPVSVLLVPHLDRIYARMGELCLGRNNDPHCWINPEFHGWWVGRECFVAVDIATGKLAKYEQFLTRFHEGYHPEYNGDQPLIHPQPAGIAFTDSVANFIGWHAITILRVAQGRSGEMRVYFYNPNNDSGQDWGNGAIVSTSGNGERHGEGSLEFELFLSRLYLFHDQPHRPTTQGKVPQEAIDRILNLAAESWAKDRLPG